MARSVHSEEIYLVAGRQTLLWILGLARYALLAVFLLFLWALFRLLRADRDA